MIQHKDNKTKVNKNKGCTIYRNLSTLDDVDAVQGLHFPGGWYGDTQKGRGCCVEKQVMAVCTIRYGYSPGVDINGRNNGLMNLSGCLILLEICVTCWKHVGWLMFTK